MSLVEKYLPNDSKISTTELDINSLIESLVIGKDELSVVILGQTIKVSTKEDISIEALGAKVSLSSSSESVRAEEEKGIELSVLLPYVDLVIEYLNKNYISIDVNTSIVYNDINISVTGQVLVDIKNLVISGDLTIGVLGQELGVKVLVANNKVSIKVGNNLGISLTIEELMSYLGQGESSTEVNSILESLNISEEESGLLVSILGINIHLSLEGSNLRVKLDEINISGISISETEVSLNPTSQFEASEITTTIGKAELDNLIEIVNKVVNILTTDNIEVSLSVAGIEANIVIDKNFNISAAIVVSGEIINVYYINKLVYINYGNIGFYGSINDIITLISSLDIVADSNTAIDFDLNNLIEKLVVSTNALEMSIMGYNLLINVNESIYVVENSLGLQATISSTTRLVDNIKEVNYVDITSLMVFVPTINLVLANNTINLALTSDIVIKNTSYPLNVQMSMTKDMIMQATIKLADKMTIYASMDGDLLKIKFNNNVVSLTISELLSLFTNSNMRSTISTTITDILFGLIVKDEKLELTLNLPEIGVVMLVIDKNLNLEISDLTLGDIKLTNSLANTTINNDNVETIKEEPTLNYQDAEIVKEEVSQVIEVINNGIIKLDLNTTLIAETTTFGVVGTIYLDINKLTFSATITFITSQGIHHVVYIDYLDDYLSISFGNIGVKAMLSELEGLITEALTMFNLDMLATNATTIDIANILNSLILSANDGLSLEIELPIVGLVGLQLKNGVLKISDMAIGDVSLTNISFNVNQADEVVYNNRNVNYLTSKDLSTLLAMVNNIMNLAKTSGFKFIINGDVAISGKTYSLSGEVDILLTNGLEVKANLTILGEHSITIYRKIEENGQAVYYAIYDNLALNDVDAEGNSDTTSTLNIMANETDLSGFLDTLSNFFNFDFSQVESDISSLEGFNIVDLVDQIDFAKLLKSLDIIYSDETVLKIVVDKNFLNATSDLSISLIFSNNDDTLNLARAEIANLAISGILIQQFDLTYNGVFSDEINVPDLTYYDLSMLNPLFKTIFNTALLTDFHISGTFNVSGKLLSLFNINEEVNIDIYVKRIEGTAYPEVYVKIWEIPVISLVNNDLEFNGAKGSAGGRCLEIFYSNREVYLYRTETAKISSGWLGLGSKNVPYAKKVKIADTEFISNILYYLLDYGFGFSDDIMNAITGSISTNENVDFTNVITNFNVNEAGNYVIGINLREITGNSDLENFDVEISTTTVEDKTYLATFDFTMKLPLAPGIFEMTISTSDSAPLTLFDIGQVVDMSYLYNFVNSNKDMAINTYYESVDNVWSVVGSVVTVQADLASIGGKEEYTLV